MIFLKLFHRHEFHAVSDEEIQQAFKQAIPVNFTLIVKGALRNRTKEK